MVQRTFFAEGIKSRGNPCITHPVYTSLLTLTHPRPRPLFAVGWESQQKVGGFNLAGPSGVDSTVDSRLCSHPAGIGTKTDQHVVLGFRTTEKQVCRPPRQRSQVPVQHKSTCTWHVHSRRSSSTSASPIKFSSNKMPEQTENREKGIPPIWKSRNDSGPTRTMALQFHVAGKFALHTDHNTWASPQEKTPKVVKQMLKSRRKPQWSSQTQCEQSNGDPSASRRRSVSCRVVSYCPVWCPV